MSSSESDWSLRLARLGAVGGSSERGAGGREGPRIRRRLPEPEETEELRDLGGGDGTGEGLSGCCRLRFARRWGGSSGPAVDILQNQLYVQNVSVEEELSEWFIRRISGESNDLIS